MISLSALESSTKAAPCCYCWKFKMRSPWGLPMDSTAEFAPLQLRSVDQIQWRYEIIRPLVLFADRTATQRAHETATHPDTVRTLHRRFRQQGMVGLLPANVEVRQR